MSDLPKNFRPKAPVSGTIKIGDVDFISDKPRPKKLDYFRYCEPQPNKTGCYPDHHAMAEANAAKPKSIPIELPSDDIGLLLEQSRVLMGRGCTLCRSIGQGNAQRRVGMAPEGVFEDIGGCGDGCPYSKPDAGILKCKVATIFRVIVPGHTPIGSVWQFRSHGWNTASEIKGSLEALKRTTGGILAYLPLRLVIREQKRAYVNNGKRSTASFWTVAVEFDGDIEKLIECLEKAKSIRDRLAALGNPVEKALAAQGQTIGFESPAEEKAVALEFGPVDAEWAEEEIRQAKQTVDDIAGLLEEWGCGEADIAFQTGKMRDKIGSPDLTFEQFSNQSAAFADRLAEKYQPKSQKEQ